MYVLIDRCRILHFTFLHFTFLHSTFLHFIPFHSSFTPLEWALPDPTPKHAGSCYLKVLCDKSDQDRVVGFHILGPNCGEITQGFATAMKLNATYSDFRDTIGIHPTVAESFTTVSVTKSSGEAADAGGC